MLTRSDVITSLKENSDRFQKEFHIKKMGLFGSFSRNQQTDQSDIDLIIELEANTPDIFETKQQLRAYLSKLFSRNIDLASYRYLKPYAQREIFNEIEPIV